MTLIEAVVILFALALLTLTMVPALIAAHHPNRERISCVNNLKQIGLAYSLWAGDHGGRFPMNVSVTNGGTAELVRTGDAWKTFQVMSNELLSPKILVCPADLRHVRPAAGFGDELKNRMSYFIGLDAQTNDPHALLSGDDNLAVNGARVLPGELNLWTNSATWDRERHHFVGYLGLADGSVLSAKRVGFNSSPGTLFATNPVVIP
jgi:hypothetical protein